MGQIRCAIYTRKSSEEGLEQSFNSLDAQREACEAYIRSQRHEGWHAISAYYDDGGFSGGNLDRPALKRLMADIEAGKVNVVVVYKVDRLTRSLADFAKIIDQFDKQEISFVSVTQQFNTTSSMGRLTLNVLLSFAQFEREVTGERIRDKIAASKKKGMWMGGTVPLGYEVRDRKLVINQEEAARVRLIFQSFLEQRSVLALQDWLRTNDVRSKGGNDFTRGPLYQMLRNPLYMGLIRHRNDTYPGQHEAIVDRETWDKVQALLNDNRQGERRKPRATKVSLLTGIIFDSAGTLFTPTHTNKTGRRYRYYASQAIIRKATETHVPARIPAHDLEAAVAGRIVRLLQTPEELLAIFGDNDNHNGRRYSALIAQASATASAWASRTTAFQEEFLKAILDRVIVHPDHVEIRIRAQQLEQVILAHKSAGAKNAQSMPDRERIISLDCPFRHIQKGKALRLVVGENPAPPEATRVAILKAIARARLWYDQLISGEASDLRDLAKLHHVSSRYIRVIFRLASLSPASVESILNQRNRAELSLNELCGLAKMPWETQGIAL